MIVTLEKRLTNDIAITTSDITPPSADSKNRKVGISRLKKDI